MIESQFEMRSNCMNALAFKKYTTNFEGIASTWHTPSPDEYNRQKLTSTSEQKKTKQRRHTHCKFFGTTNVQGTKISTHQHLR